MTVDKLIQRADEARNNGQIVLAEESYREALSLSPPVEQELHCVWMQGVCRRQVCDFAGAAHFYGEAARFASTHRLDTGGIKRDEAIAVMLQGNLAMAFTLYEESAELLANGPRDQLGITYIKWGYCQLLLDKPTEAEAMIRAGMTMAEDTPFFVGTGHIHLAEVFIASGQYDRALTNLELARRIFAKPAKIWRLAEVYGFKAICHTHLRDRNEAEFALERSQGLMEKARMPEESLTHLMQTLRTDETARLIAAM